MSGQQRADNPMLGMSLAALVMLFIPMIDAFAKLLARDISPVEISWFRFLIQFVVLLPFLIWRTGLPKVKSFLPLVLRGIMMSLASLFMVLGVRIMPIADCITIFFIEPLIVTVLSVVFLGEKIGPRRIIALIIGFTGVLIALRPSFEAVGYGVLFPVGAAFSLAGYVTITRYFSASEDAISMQCSVGFVGFVFMSLVALCGGFFDWPIAQFTPLASHHIWLILLYGLVGSAAHILLAFSYRLAEAGLLAPLQYLEIIGAVFFGYLFFRDLPEPLTWLGIVIIASSGAYLFYRERVVHLKIQAEIRQRSLRL